MTIPSAMSTADETPTTPYTIETRPTVELTLFPDELLESLSLFVVSESGITPKRAGGPLLELSLLLLLLLLLLPLPLLLLSLSLLSNSIG